MSKKDEKNNPSKEEAEENKQQELTEESEAIVIETDEESEAQKKIDEYKDIAQRLQAEFDNYRKRNNESVRVARNEGIDDVICSMLGILDNFERGAKALEKVEDCQTVKDSFNLVHKQVIETLEKLGLEPIETEGKTFDPNFHDAVMQTPNNDVPEHTILNELQKGYKLGDKVLRPALVNVATQG